MSETKQEEKSLIQRTEKHFKSRMEDIYILNELEMLEEENEDYSYIIDDIKSRYGQKNEYGLSIDYVKEGTFSDQREPFIRFQISWGGPSEEFRFFADNSCEFWFLDWGCGEKKHLSENEKQEVLNFLSVSDYEELKHMYGG